MTSPGGKKGLLGSDLAGDVTVKARHPSDAVTGYFHGNLTVCEHSYLCAHIGNTMHRDERGLPSGMSSSEVLGEARAWGQKGGDRKRGGLGKSSHLCRGL